MGVPPNTKMDDLGVSATLALESVNTPSATDATGFRGPFLGLDLT
jgi:hypothetical protein